MRRGLCGVILLAVAVGTWAWPAWGGGAFRVKMPFAFGAGDETFPKGRCTVDLSWDNKVLIQCAGTRAIVTTQSLEFTGNPLQVMNTKEMVFKRYGKQYLLSEVWVASRGLELVQSNAEKKLVESGVESVRVRLKLK